MAEQRAHTLKGQRIANTVVRALLRTPGLARIIGAKLVTLYVVGRKSQRRYAIPVAYLADGGDLLIGTPFAWGKNLRTGSPITLRLKGRLRTADVDVATAEPEVVAGYALMARSNPTFAKFNDIRLGDDGEPDPDDLHQAWLGGARVIRLSPRAA